MSQRQSSGGWGLRKLKCSKSFRCNTQGLQCVEPQGLEAVIGEDKTHVHPSVSLHGLRRMGRGPVMGSVGFWTPVRLEVTRLSLPRPPDCKPALLGGEAGWGSGVGLCSLELKRCTQCTWPLLWGSPRKLSRAPGAGLLGWGGVPWHHLPLILVQAWDEELCCPQSHGSRRVSLRGCFLWP